MKEYSIAYLDKFYFVDKEFKIHSHDTLYDGPKLHPKDLQFDLTSILGVDDDFALIVINEWMYSHGIRQLNTQWEAIWWSGLPMLDSSHYATAIGASDMSTTLSIANNNSIAIGQNARAIGQNSIAIGNGAVARDGQICIRTDGPNQGNTGNVIFNGRDITDQIGEAINHALNVHPYE
jgi:hypothetical protein